MATPPSIKRREEGKAKEGAIGGIESPGAQSHGERHGCTVSHTQLAESHGGSNFERVLLEQRAQIWRGITWLLPSYPFSLQLTLRCLNCLVEACTIETALHMDIADTHSATMSAYSGRISMLLGALLNHAL